MSGEGELLRPVGMTTTKHRLRRIAGVAVIALLAFNPLLAQDSRSDLTQVTLEELMNIQVTSVSKKDQQAFKAGAAIFVITQEDIRSSGASNIPDLLRMAPGVNVARVDANTWAISIRGFNGIYADKLLVLVDGRSVYTPASPGVNWDQINVPLENIDRIEVIRGPGGTVWGANAVNGVINIITSSSKATKGGLIVAGAGSEERASGLVQYGGDIGGTGSYRAFGSYANTNNAILAGGADAADGWHTVSGGFRSDWDLSNRDTFSIEGNLLQNREGQTVTQVLSDHLPTVATFNDPIQVASGDVLAKWDHTLQGGSNFSVQTYYSRYNRLSSGYRNILDTFDLEFQHHLAVGSRQDVVWGGDFRYTGSSVTTGYSVSFSPAQESDSLFNAFLQDQIRLTSSLDLTVGSKFGHNQLSGFEFEPSAQLVWTPSNNHTLWASAAQAISQPSIYSAAIRYDAAVIPLPGGAFGVLTEFGSPDLKAEQLRDYEGGYRTRIGKRWSLDLTLFRSYYHNLQTASPGAPYLSERSGVPFEEFPYYAGNLARERTYGGEIFGNWQVRNRWRISPGFSLLHMRTLAVPAGALMTSGSPGDNPKHQVELRSLVNLRRNLDWDTAVYFVGELANGPIPAYTRVDTHLGWRIGETLEFSVAGQNLLTPRHFEAAYAYILSPTQIERSVLGRITWRF
jgi:iron complex outermembrane receptor protein